MSSLQTSLLRRVVLVILVFSLTLVGARGQSIVYNATVLPANPQAGVVHYLQQLTLAGPNGTYSITQMTFGINWSDDSADQGLILQFYTGLDLSPGSSDVLAGATLVGDAGFLLPSPGATGNFTYTLTFGTPISVPSNSIGIEALLTDDTGGNFATGINGRFTSNTPTVGTAPGFVWNDSDLDGTFTGANQTNFGMSGAYIRMSVTAVAPVPEPNTMIMTAVGGLGFLILLMRRRRA